MYLFRQLKKSSSIGRDLTGPSAEIELDHAVLVFFRTRCHLSTSYGTGSVAATIPILCEYYVEFFLSCWYLGSSSVATKLVLIPVVTFHLEQIQNLLILCASHAVCHTFDTRYMRNLPTTLGATISVAPRRRLFFVHKCFARIPTF